MQMLLAFALAAAAAGAAPGATPAPPAPSFTFDNVRLLVTRFDDTYAFYRDVLGLKSTGGKPGDNYASFVFPGGGQVALFRRSMMADALGAAARPATRQEQDTIALILSVGDVDEACAHLRRRGVDVIDPPQDRKAWGIRAAHFRDPDGNLIEIYSPLKG